MRDRLLSSHTVAPAMRRIRRSLLTSSAASVASVVLLQAAPNSSLGAHSEQPSQLQPESAVASQCGLVVICHSLLERCQSFAMLYVAEP